MATLKNTLFFLLIPILLQAQDSGKEFLLKSCRLSILSQEVTKSYIAASLRVDRAAQIRKIQDNALTFDDYLDELSVLLPSFKMQEYVSKINKSWKVHKKIVLKAYNKKHFSKLEASNKQLLADCKTLTADLINFVNRKGKAVELSPEMMDVDLVEVINEQIMLSQAIASHFFTLAWGLDHAMTSKTYHGAIIQYEENLQKLIELEEHQPDYSDFIDESLLHWCAMESICTKLGGPSKNKADLQTILKTGAELLKHNTVFLDHLLRL